MLAYSENGQGSPLVLVHGIAASAQQWEGLAPFLAQTGFRVLTVDLPGHGCSPKPKDPAFYNISALYKSFEDWLKETVGTCPVTLVGHSLGGYLCLEYSARWPEQIQALVLLNPLYKAGQLSPLLRFFRRYPLIPERLLAVSPSRLVEFAARWAPLWLDGVPGQARRQAARSLKRASPQILRYARDIPDLTPRLDRIQAKTLVIWSENDLTLDPGSFEPLIAAIPHARRLVVPHCGHQTHIIRPKIVAAALLDFLSPIDAGVKAGPAISTGPAR